jgi:ketosteroid isomerase-like protein
MSGPAPTAPPTSSASTTVNALRDAGERGDADAVADLLAPDIVFHSPFTARLRFEGREEVTALHRDIFAVLEGIDTTEPLALGDTRAFTFHAHVRGVELEAIAVVRCNEQGQIADYKLFVRPIPGLATLFATLPPRVSARRRGRLHGATMAVLTRPLAFALRAADRFAPSFL